MGSRVTFRRLAASVIWMHYVTLGSVVALVVTIGAAAFLRNRLFATFAGVILTVHTLIAVATAPAFAAVLPAWVYLHAAVYVHFLLLARPRMRPLAYRVLVSIPASFFAAGTMLSLPWAVVAAFGAHLPLPWLPYALALVGIAQSLRTGEEELDVVLTGEPVEGLRRHAARVGEKQERPLRIVQISDPHLGPFMSVERLRRICQRAVERNPDLVLLTGDFLTMESQSDPRLLEEALSPLRALPGRVFACNGNHDHEAPATVAHGLASAGVIHLVDDAAEVDTEAGPVQLVGLDFLWRDRASKMAAVLANHPRKKGVLRVVLLHDPGAFREIPEGDADLVLSGHTHGGQVGLVSLGLPLTFISAFSSRFPDHGFWARGTDRLYVHRGTGHYGFPLRVGVPGEESVMRVHWASP